MARTGLEVAVSIGFGLVIGFGVTTLAVGMAGAGHGWCSAMISSVSIIGAPLAGLAWSLPNPRGRLTLAITVSLAALVFDLLLLQATLSEGVSYVVKVWRSGAGLVLVWGVMFASWQVLAMLALLTSWRGRNAS